MVVNSRLILLFYFKHRIKKGESYEPAVCTRTREEMEKAVKRHMAPLDPPFLGLGFGGHETMMISQKNDGLSIVFFI